MSIQPSVLIWTVICFGVFCVVINKMLFAPILKVMDKRRERVENAKQRADELERQKAEELLETEKQAQLKKEQAAENIKAEIAQFNEDSKSELENIHAKNEKNLEEKRNKLKAASDSNNAIISAKMDDFVAAFTEKLTSYR